ncbi:hypothetical protein [Nocardia sp. NPDC004860]|uniref:hypothetical protein n=1 Tax=Nocardia sp. NPDC004860 TaxID=3154557 RepID=UPI0033ABC342
MGGEPIARAILQLLNRFRRVGGPRVTRRAAGSWNLFVTEAHVAATAEGPPAVSSNSVPLIAGLLSSLSAQ